MYRGCEASLAKGSSGQPYGTFYHCSRTTASGLCFLQRDWWSRELAVVHALVLVSTLAQLSLMSDV